MSKTDAIRAMKQARAEAQRASAPAAPASRPAARAASAAAGRPAGPAAATAAATSAVTSTRAASDDAPGTSLPADLVPEALCGHTAISGRRCTRPQGHAEKNHRYAA